jgi:diadenosine tetraphosphate (Ap4A) HIT family hydrolase
MKKDEVLFTLRKPESEAIYGEFKKRMDKNYCPFCNRDLMRREFKYWIIVENRFPYDKVFKRHDILACKRHIKEWTEMTKDEWAELKSIEYQIMNGEVGDYNLVIINVPKDRSIPRHLHFHLATYKNRN